MLRSVREEPAVTLVLKSAAITYPRLWQAFDGLCWFLARHTPHGAKFAHDRGVFYLHKQAGGGFGVPALTVIYSISDDVVSLHAIKVG